VPRDWADEFARGVSDLNIDESEAARTLEEVWGAGARQNEWAGEFEAATNEEVCMCPACM
jgi:hypothetical protein